jgi:Mor family transcriptional regulator
MTTKAKVEKNMIDYGIIDNDPGDFPLIEDLIESADFYKLVSIVGLGNALFVAEAFKDKSFVFHEGLVWIIRLRNKRFLRDLEKGFTREELRKKYDLCLPRVDEIIDGQNRRVKLSC